MIPMSLLRLEGAAYWIGFVAVFLACAVWESFAPRAELSDPAERRWKNHGVLFVLGAGLGAIVLRLSPVAAAMLVADSRFGVLNKPWAPLAVRCAIAVLLLDLLQYWTHWSMHRVPLLWRIHLVHHSDRDVDVSTSVRHHPLEALYTQSLRLGFIALLAPPVAGVFAASLLSAVVDLWTHSNASLPAPLENLLRVLVITPDLHRIHHSQDATEQQENLGQIFPWWDRLFVSYAGQPLAAAECFQAGLAGLEGQDSLSVGFMLAEPFQKTAVEPGLSSNAPAAPVAD